MNVLDIFKINISDAKKLNIKDISFLYQKMEILCVKNKIISLSAVQVGVDYNLFVYCLGCYKSYRCMVDCTYKPENQNKFFSIEGCQSIEKNQKRYKVERYENVIIEGKELLINDLKLVDFKKTFSKSMECCIFQHEIDHYNNISIDKIGKEIYIHESIKT